MTSPRRHVRFWAACGFVVLACGLVALGLVVYLPLNALLN